MLTMKKVELFIINLANLSKDDLFKFELTDDELNKIKNNKNALQDAASLYLKKRFIGEYSLNEHDKPISDKVKFNISHSNDYVVLAISDVDVGVDIEKIRPFKPNMIDFVSTKEEKEAIVDEESFFKVWTAKEALLKCLGTGLSLPLKIVPALPFEGKKEFQKQLFYSKQMKIEDYVLTVTIASKSNFKIDLKEIKLDK